MPKHSIRAGDIRIGKAVEEMFEDNLADIIRHYQDISTLPAASTITLKIKVTPDERREQFKFEASASTSLSARRGFEGSLYGEVDEDGHVGVVEYNPKQMRIPFDRAESADS